ncbi:MAG: hypothetical protein Q7S16_02265 [bacterium]|nr:hypothetical protein [bacterium]
MNKKEVSAPFTLMRILALTCVFFGGMLGTIGFGNPTIPHVRLVTACAGILLVVGAAFWVVDHHSRKEHSSPEMLMLWAFRFFGGLGLFNLLVVWRRMS